MSEEIEILNQWFDKVYKEKIHVACLELPILKLLIENDGSVTREEIITKLEDYGNFKRSALSLDHLWSQRFGKGEEQTILNKLVQHNGENAGDKKTEYKIFDNINKLDIKNLLSSYNDNQIEDLINIRLEYVSSGITDEQQEFFYELAKKYNLLSRAPHMSKGRVYYQLYPNKTPYEEGTGGCHYEFGFDKNSQKLKLFLHVEKNVKRKKELKNILNLKNPTIADITDLDNEEIESIFSDMINKYEEKINKFYFHQDQNNGENSMQDGSKRAQPLNQILYGPPGTGKTFTTINKALKIIFEKEDSENMEFYEFDFDKKLKISYKDALKLEDEQYKRKVLKGIYEHFIGTQIEFVTFHQSYGYEEFVEGIKAQTITDNTTKQKTITYDVEAGTFKRLCEQAKTIKSEKTSAYNFDENINIWKISLGDSQNSEDEYLFDYCIENNKILLGFGEGIDFNGCKNREEIAKKLKDTEKYSYPPSAINTLKNKMKIGDIVLVSYGNRKLRSIAKITGEYQHLEDDNLKTYVQSRDVEWLLVPEEPFSYEKILKKQFSQMTIYDIKSNVKIEELRKILTQDNKHTEENNKNYILIIDEINRGNISKIFGELITLIEPSKRIGADEEIMVKLPYSNEMFGVPKNLYILGTMNTADRSIALMDTALRRRFHFEEMMPKPELLDFKVKVNEIEIDIKSILETINKRIEYLYDRDHTIGHAYFMSLTDEAIIDKKAELDNIFRNKIIPLLQEYFYDDWEKILMILGKDGFIEKKEINTDIFSYKNEDYIEDESPTYKIKKEFDYSEFKDDN